MHLIVLPIHREPVPSPSSPTFPAPVTATPAPVTATPAPVTASPAPLHRMRSGVRIRPITPGDLESLRSFYASLSEDSRRTRFFGPTAGIGIGQSAYFCTPDHAHREGFVAVVSVPVVDRPGAAGDGAEQIVGHVCVEPDGADRAEVAIAVSDAFQGQGIGHRLVRSAIEWARRDGIRRLTATMLVGNAAIQRLMQHLGLPTTVRPLGAGVVEVTIAIPAEESAA
jgi:acetyltransferase